MRKILSLLVLAAALVGSARAADPIKVISFSAILSEIATEVGGDAVEVVGLVKPGVDPHGYQPTPADLRQLVGARLILASGKNLEPYIDKLQVAAGGDARLLKVGDSIPSLEAAEGGHDHGHAHGHGADAGEHEIDPHWWHSVANVRRATQTIRDALISLDPANKAAFEKNAAAYLDRLAALDKWIKQQVALIPRDQRRLVTSHDAFQYFARDYGFRIQAIEGLSTEQEASARHVDEVIATIRRDGVKAVFFEDTLNPKVTAEITRESGAKVGGMLYADGPGADAPTYEAMQRHNISTIVEALR